MASPTCPFCNQPLRAGAKYCTRCGRAVIARMMTTDKTEMNGQTHPSSPFVFALVRCNP